MKKSLITLLALFTAVNLAWADGKQEALKFFNNYVNAANTYDTSVGDMYSPSAKIIGEVVKPDGGLVDVGTDTATYVKQMKLSQATVKLRKYTNAYSKITVTDLGNGKYKVSALRQPKGETYYLKMYQVIQKQPDGKWLIVEEMMQTKEQIFLKFQGKNN